MVISCSTCQKEDKDDTWVKYLISVVVSQFKKCSNLRVFPPNLYSQNIRVHNKTIFSKSEPQPQQQTLPLLTLPNLHSRMFQKGQKHINEIKFAEVKYNLKA